MKKICPNCGKKIDNFENFCPYCGLSLTGNKRYSDKENVSPIELLLLCICCTPLGALIYYIVSKSD